MALSGIKSLSSSHTVPDQAGSTAIDQTIASTTKAVATGRLRRFCHVFPSDQTSPYAGSHPPATAPTPTPGSRQLMLSSFDVWRSVPMLWRVSRLATHIKFTFIGRVFEDDIQLNLSLVGTGMGTGNTIRADETVLSASADRQAATWTVPVRNFRGQTVQAFLWFRSEFDPSTAVAADNGYCFTGFADSYGWWEPSNIHGGPNQASITGTLTNTTAASYPAWPTAFGVGAEGAVWPTGNYELYPQVVRWFDYTTGLVEAASAREIIWQIEGVGGNANTAGRVTFMSPPQLVSYGVSQSTLLALTYYTWKTYPLAYLYLDSIEIRELNQ